MSFFKTIQNILCHHDPLVICDYYEWYDTETKAILPDIKDVKNADEVASALLSFFNSEKRCYWKHCFPNQDYIVSQELANDLWNAVKQEQRRRIRMCKGCRVRVLQRPDYRFGFCLYCRPVIRAPQRATEWRGPFFYG